MGTYEDELRSIVSAERWDIPAMLAMRGALESLVRMVPAALQPEGWTGTAADNAKKVSDALLERFGKVTDVLDKADAAIKAANDASDRAAEKIGELPGAKVDPFWVNAARTASSVVYFGQTLPADTAISFIQAHLGSQREDAAQAAVEGLKSDLVAPTNHVRDSREELRRIPGLELPPVPDPEPAPEDGPTNNSGGPTTPGGPGNTGGTGTGIGLGAGGGSSTGSGSGSSIGYIGGGSTETGGGWRPPVSNDDGLLDGGTSVDGGVGTGTLPGTGTGTGGSGGSGGSGIGSGHLPGGSGAGSGLMGGGAGAAALAAAKLGGAAGAAGKLGLGGAGGGAGGRLGIGGAGGAGGAGAGAGGRLGSGGLLGSTGSGGAGAAAGGAGGGAGTAAAAGGRGSGMMGGGGGGAGGDKDKRSGLGGLMAPRLEDEDEAAPRSTGASAGGRQPKSED